MPRRSPFLALPRRSGTFSHRVVGARIGAAHVAPTMMLTQRDLHIVIFVHRLEGCATDHVRQRFFATTARTTVHRRLSRLIAGQYLVSRRLPAEDTGGSGQAWLTIGPAAVPLLDRYFSLTLCEKKQLRHQVILPHWRHELELRTVRVCLELAVERSGVITLDDWVSERVLRQHAFAAIDQITKTTVHLTPDGQFTLLLGDGPSHRFYVELDRGTAASRQRYLPKLRAYLQRSDAATVLFIAPDVSRATQLSRWIAHAAHQLDVDPGIFLITTKDRLNPRSLLAAPIWQAVTQEAQALIDRLVPTPSAPQRRDTERGNPDELSLQ